MSRIPSCSSCGAQILWAVTALGKRMPVDRAPDPEVGNVVLDWPDGDRAPRARVFASPAVAREVEGLGVVLRTSHFVTCDHANDHRRRAAAPSTRPAAQPEPAPDPYEQGVLL